MNIEEITHSFLTLVGSGNVQQGFDRFTAAEFIHHNQYFEGSREALIKAMEEDHQKNPNESLKIKYSYVDGSTVILHSHVVKQEMEIAVVHIFRFQEDKIVELWDLGQVMEQNSPNEQGLF
ncbi:MAG: polyketide cyclase [Flavobacteriaceae bacterium]|nr:polyketide cyclase [Flavobacteriaceae bacterium]|tara:strand:+ start:5217 stop:5579 length:363 start_codon:yes stop_codon:yes gene_type:complete